MKIIIVDDDATTLTVLGALLQSRGHEVIERDKAIGTTLAILREKPDVVLLDVRMPGLDGDKLASLINQDSTHRVIIVLHSSLPRDELGALSAASGAAGFISKSGDPSAFLHEFDRVIAAARQSPARKRA